LERTQESIPFPKDQARQSTEQVRLKNLVWLLAAITLILGLVEVSAPLPVLLDRFLPDDAFYYLKPAQNFAAQGFSSFDGIHFTNGYQPLWFLTLIPVFVLFPAGGELPLRLVLLVQVGLAVLTTVLLLRSVNRLFGIVPAMIAGAAWIFWFHSALINGLETALLMCLYLLLFGFYVRFLQAPAIGARDYAILGTLSSLVFLARTDSVFLVACISLAILLDPRLRRLPAQQVLRLLLAYASPLLILAGGYLMLNLFSTGHIMPVSGAAKIYYSGLARDHAASEAAASTFGVSLANLFWVLEYRNYSYVLFGIAIFLLSATVSLVPGVIRFTRPLLRLWPLFLGGLASYAYYSLAYFGIFTRTVWYYAPATFLTCLSLAWLAYTLMQLLAPRFSASQSLNTRLILAAMVALVLLVAGVAPLIKLSEDRFSPARRWNYNLYLGASWARENLPPDATIWSGSAGILGYFSGRTVINTDGLANNYAFLEDVIRKDRLSEYVTQWEYAIDAFPVGSNELETRFPEGCFVPLPGDLQSYPFQDGSLTRRLAVYQMKARGVVDCRQVEGSGS
jgi:hypothetical protein